MADYKKLAVWKKSHEMVLRIYHLSSTFPSSEVYGLTSQIRRSALSIPSNIAEGSGRGTDGDFVRFLGIARGSATELEYQALLAHHLHFIAAEDYEKLDQDIAEILRMITGLIQKLSTPRH